MAVYTDVDDEALEAFVEQYDLGALMACKGIAEGVENSNFLLQTERGMFILTIYEKRVEESDLPFFLGLMEHLAERGIPCPTPVHGRDGKALRRLMDKPAAIVTFLPGVWHKRPNPIHCGGVGEALAGMHLAGADFHITRKNALDLDGWATLIDACRESADRVRDGLARVIDEEYEFLRDHWPRDLPAGVIHADLFPDNVFFKGDQLSGLIDFYFACNDSFAYDLGICLNAWCFEPAGDFNITKARRLIQSYQGVRAISQAELEALPLLCRGSSLRFLLTRLYDWLNQVEGALVKPKDPLEYLHKLHFHQRVETAAVYGLD